MPPELVEPDVVSFEEPTSLEEAIACKATAPERTTFWSGGTDLGVLLRRQQLQPSRLVALHRVEELRRLETRGDPIRIGAGVTHRQIERSPAFGGAYLALRQACETIGSVQTRNVGTIGGNLANASPAADTPPVLLALGADVVLAGPHSQRTVTLDDFFLDYRQTALAPDELILAVEIPTMPATGGSAFSKLGRRRAMEISIACVGAFLEFDAEGSCVRAGVGLGAVAPTPVRAVGVQELLVGRQPTDDVLANAATAAGDVVRPIDDARASASYRRDVIVPLVRRTLEAARDRAGATS